MKYRILLALLAITAHMRSETLLQFMGDAYLTESESLVVAFSSIEEGKHTAIIENRSNLPISYVASTRTFPRLCTEKFNGKEWEFTRSDLCGGVVERYFIQPGSTQKIDLYKIPERGFYRYYFTFSIPGSKKQGVIRVAELETK